MVQTGALMKWWTSALKEELSHAFGKRFGVEARGMIRIQLCLLGWELPTNVTAACMRTEETSVHTKVIFSCVCETESLFWNRIIIFIIK